MHRGWFAMRARDLSIHTKLVLLVGMFAAGFAAFIIVVSAEMKPRLEDSDYNDVVTMKDVLADVLPPPKYVIEPYLVLLQLAYQDDAASRDALIRSWQALEAAFEDRQRHWAAALPDGSRPSHDGLYVQDAHGRPQCLQARGLRKMVEAAAASARVVVLNACYSSSHADELRSVVDCVVGMTGAISDAAARNIRGSVLPCPRQSPVRWQCSGASARCLCGRGAPQRATPLLHNSRRS
jgi:hypothetical protein